MSPRRDAPKASQDRARGPGRPVAAIGRPETPYARLSLAQKQRQALERMREPAVACPRCETQTTTADLMRHMGTCTGPREPHPAGKWVGWRAALELGVSAGTMGTWIRRGVIRWREGDPRQYLVRDLVRRLAGRMRRRDPSNEKRRKNR